MKYELGLSCCYTLHTYTNKKSKSQFDIQKRNSNIKIERINLKPKIKVIINKTKIKIKSRHQNQNLKSNKKAVSGQPFAQLGWAKSCTAWLSSID